MKVSFKIAGIEVSAQGTYYPLIQGCIFCQPDNRAPDEGGEFEIDELFVKGQPATFLLDSSLKEEINEAAYLAAIKQINEDRADAQIFNNF
jgi:hypothetical protein